MFVHIFEGFPLAFALAMAIFKSQLVSVFIASLTVDMLMAVLTARDRVVCSGGSDL